MRPCQESNPGLRGGRRECYHSATVAPCYSSEKFHQFFQGFGFQQVTSSPHFPQSNGFFESPVSTAKATLKKCTLGKCDPDLAFLLLRSAPVSNSLPSPAELLYNRPVRSVLPSDTKYRRELESTKSVLAQMQANMKAYYNNGTKELAPLKLYDTVMVQSHDLDWSPGTIVSATEEPGSYIVQTTEGARYRRNRRFICKMPNKSVCTESVLQTMVTLLIVTSNQTEIHDNCHSRKSHKSVKISDSSKPGLSEHRRSPCETRPTKRPKMEKVEHFM